MNVLELITLSIMPIPFYDKCITLKGDVRMLLSDFFLAFMFLRLFQLIRTSFNYSVYMDPLSKKICKGYGLTADIRFTIQSKLLVDPFETSFIMFFGTVLIFAYLVRIFELPPLVQSGETSSYVSFFNAMWFTVITLTTIGYGDISPGTVPGKIVTILLAFWGAIFIALLVSIVSNIFNLSNRQEKALRQLRLTRQASKAICASIEYFRAKKDLGMLKY